ncbi:MAG: hypothetical protein Q8M06_00845 [Methanobacteriaceae archaeon]|nr:hypothetical protein [Methanobacteriaceae archaeon]
MSAKASCHTCEDVCPCNAISIVDNHSVINPKIWVLCCAYARVCPQKGIVIERNDMELTMCIPNIGIND